MIQIVFLRPKYLWLLLFIPLLVIVHFLVLKYLRRRALKFANFDAIKRVVGPQGSLKNTTTLSKNIGLLVLRIIALFLIITAISTPILYYTGRTTRSSFVLAIDASSSMLAGDFEPTRLEAAKKAAISFVTKLPKHSVIGVVDFSGASFVKKQLTTNKKEVIEAIRNIEVENVGGTDLGTAIITSTNMLLNQEGSRVVILLTDGRSNVGVDPREAVDYAVSKNTQVFTIGIATKKGASLFAPELITTIDEDTLKFIAEKTNAKYFRAENPEELRRAYNEIAEQTNKRISKNISFHLLTIAIIILFIEWALANTRYRTLP